MTGALVLREARRGFSGTAWLPVAFFLIVATIVPFAVGPDAALLGRIGGGALWIAAHRSNGGAVLAASHGALDGEWRELAL